jgi:hypothetical protein
MDDKPDGERDVSAPLADPPDAGVSPPSRPFPRWLKWFIGVSAGVVAVGLAGTLIRLPYYTYSPGDALDLSSRVRVRGAETY